jgi:hypothetical protein
MKNVFNKDTALEIAYVGAGAVAGKIAGDKIYDQISAKVDAEGKFEPYLKGAVPILVGLFLPSLVGSSKAVRGIANGMIASGSSTIVGGLLKKAGVMQGVGNVMMGNVMMGNAYAGSDASDLGNNTYLGNPAQGTDDYTSTSYDFTSADAGEMDY